MERVYPVEKLINFCVFFVFLTKGVVRRRGRDVREFAATKRQLCDLG